MTFLTLRGLNRNFIRVAAALLIWGVGEGMFYPFQSLYLQEWNADPVTIGAVLSGVGIAMALSFIPAGYFSDRLGPRPVMLSSWGIALVATLIMAFAPSLTVFIIGAILYGLTGFVTAPIMAYVSQMRGSLEVGRALTLTSASFMTGMIIGPSLGGIIATQFGLVMNYRIAILIFLVSSLVIYFIEPLPPVAHQESEKQESIWRNRRYQIFATLFFITMVALYLPQPFSPNYLQNEKGLNFEAYGQLASLGSLGVVVFSLLFGGLKPAIAFMIGQVFVSIFVISMWKGEGRLIFGLGYFFIGGYRLSVTMSMAVVKSMVGTSQLGLAYGLLSTANSMTIILSPFLAGILYDLQPDLSYKISLVGIAVIFLVNYIALPHIKPELIPQPLEANEPLNPNLRSRPS
ncbi:MAG: MFS transporter [Anaerolineaceae bacterium]